MRAYVCLCEYVCACAWVHVRVCVRVCVYECECECGWTQRKEQTPEREPIEPHPWSSEQQGSSLGSEPNPPPPPPPPRCRAASKTALHEVITPHPRTMNTLFPISGQTGKKMDTIIMMILLW
ncbi:unnamed protein product [Gadus morhua 'NCC']